MILCIVGATASGKSDLAIALALRLGGEVINADAMQVYRGLDIGTGKPTETERRGVPHHLFDVWPIDHAVSVAEYQQVARECLDDVLARGSAAVIVGGSWLYVRALLDDLRFPGTDVSIRARWEERLVAEGPRALHAVLAGLDPAAAAAIMPSNGRRLVRALEVIELTGEPFTANLPGDRPAYEAVFLGLDVPRADLDRRIAARVDRMWAGGLLDEVGRLPGLAASPTAGLALGYPQALAQLRGEMSEVEAKAETVRLTRKFARRQDRYFRRDDRVHWLSPDAAIDQALSTLT